MLPAHSDLHDLAAPYALGALDAKDRERYERHLAGCQGCRVELQALQEAASALAYGAEGRVPGPHVRARLLAQARKERPAGVVPIKRRRFPVPVAAALAAAAATVAAAVGVWGLGLSGSLERERAANGDAARALAIVAHPRSIRYPLFGARGAVVVAPGGEAALVVRRLAEAPRGKTYELWVVRGDDPLPAGLFRGGGGSTVVPLTRRVPQGAQVAVSLEPAGGVERLSGTLLFGAQTA
ncbi:MAG: anti-sigma factor domain-containing protein [Gaiellaceae bacterium]